MSLNEHGHPVYDSPKFWLDLLDIQLLEIKQDLADGDFNHAAKELADVVSVALDMFRLFFHKDAVFELNKRFAENLPKWQDPKRYTDGFQEAKLSELRAKLKERGIE